MADRKSRNISNLPIAIPDVPDAPTVSATNVGTSRAFNNGAATVNISSPTGGLPTSYSITTTPSTTTTAGVSGANTITGLASATSYTVSVTATNSAATSAATTTDAFTATTVPQAPTIGTATAVAAITPSASVTLTPNATGGSSITSYTATSSPGSITGTSASSPVTVSGLTAGTPYTFTVTATNANGTSSSSSASNSVTPSYASFLTYFSGSSTSSRITDCKTNADGIYACGYVVISGNVRGLVLRLNFDGSINWQREIYASIGTNHALSLSLDTSGNVYVGGRYYIDSTSSAESFLAKYNSSGVLQYQKRIDSGTTSPELLITLKSNTSNELIAVGSRNASGTTLPLIRKLSTTPTSTWSKTFTTFTGSDASISDEGSRVTLDASGNIYTAINASFLYVDTTYTQGYISKFDSSGNRQATNLRFGSAASNNFVITGIASGSNTTYSNDIYVCGGNDSAPVLTKLDTSLNVVWTRQLSTGVGSTFKGIAVSAAGDVYVTAYDPTSTDWRVVIAKYNTSGTLQWQRRLNSNLSQNSFEIYNISIDETRQRLVCVGQLGTSFGFTAFLPLDGTGTGTYTVGSYSIIYETTTYLTPTVTVTTSTDSNTTTVTRTDTITDSTMTEAAASHTSNNTIF